MIEVQIGFESIYQTWSVWDVLNHDFFAHGFKDLESAIAWAEEVQGLRDPDIVQYVEGSLPEDEINLSMLAMYSVVDGGIDEVIDLVEECFEGLPLDDQKSLSYVLRETVTGREFIWGWWVQTRNTSDYARDIAEDFVNEFRYRSVMI